MKPTITTLIKMGIVIDKTTSLQEKHHTKQYIIHNPYSNNSAEFMLYDRSGKKPKVNPYSNYSSACEKAPYVFRMLSKHPSSCYWYKESPIFLKGFWKKSDMLDYAFKKFLHHFFTQNFDGSADTKHPLSKGRLNKMDNLNFDELDHVALVTRLSKDPEFVRNLYLKLFK